MFAHMQQSANFSHSDNQIKKLSEYISQILLNQNQNTKNYDEKYLENFEQTQQRLSNSEAANFNENHLNKYNLQFPKQNEKDKQQIHQNFLQIKTDQQNENQNLLADLLQYSQIYFQKTQENNQGQNEVIHLNDNYITNLNNQNSFNFENEIKKAKQQIQQLICLLFFKDQEIIQLKLQLQQKFIPQSKQQQESQSLGDSLILQTVNSQLNDILRIIERKIILGDKKNSTHSNESCNSEDSISSTEFFSDNSSNLQQSLEKTETILKKIQQFIDDVNDSKKNITKQSYSQDSDLSNPLIRIQNKRQNIEFRKSKTSFSTDPKISNSDISQCNAIPRSPKRVSIILPNKEDNQSPYESARSRTSSSPEKRDLTRRKSTFFLMQKFKTFNESNSSANDKFCNTDFAGVRMEELIQSLIKKKQNEQKDNDSYFFSDQVKKFSHSKKTEEKLICLDETNFFVLNDFQSTNGYKKFPIKDISKIIISQSNDNLCSIHIQKQFELIIETSHRELFLNYILNIFQDILKMNSPEILNSATHRKQNQQQNQSVLKNAILNNTRQSLDYIVTPKSQEKIGRSFCFQNLKQS